MKILLTITVIFILTSCYPKYPMFSKETKGDFKISYGVAERYISADSFNKYYKPLLDSVHSIWPCNPDSTY